MRILLADNHDSFTRNLEHLLVAATGCVPTVVPVDRLDEVTTGWPHAFDGPAPADPAARWDLLVISPGPGTPEEYPQYAPLLGGEATRVARASRMAGATDTTGAMGGTGTTGTTGTTGDGTDATLRAGQSAGIITALAATSSPDPSVAVPAVPAATSSPDRSAVSPAATASPHCAPACPVPVPVLGICLGLQIINAHFGGVTAPLPGCVHGKPDTLHYAGQARTVARYHSLHLSAMGAGMRVLARNGQGVVMAARHRCLPLLGYQFHPESFLTPDGVWWIRHALHALCLR
ncbi:aminodeoxychorismate/anthranilate synthase component II [Nitratidesulfovibrio sp. SRB-5]|uniref:aminodeoxychorismate/anthranilate synthase component II n=1 Tax=Nitratidesulfovibrio sp. SRB-5 TaxID=2872636 RepID=UPI001024F95C|nr:aminodeoxychorismate/anthranilate synthase component II [Nitratidesulfovibrio sp. SRB-5]MBZ2170481.1 aminodeoxychorismate/anthranilate synthase component II [Nitratidesulfovibrio sp. SRB-5]RXF77991.1 aminodeoxychorismate/anthranilate synthase component II [Desulfovibrio sp. DS-1]